MTATVAYKIGHTHRIPVLATTNDGPLPLALLDIEVKLEAGDNLVTHGLGSGVGLSAGEGTFWYEVSEADRTALGDPDQCTTTINIWNADNELVMTGAGVVNFTI